jgi:hypothetical protein
MDDHQDVIGLGCPRRQCAVGTERGMNQDNVAIARLAPGWRVAAVIKQHNISPLLHQSRAKVAREGRDIHGPASEHGNAPAGAARHQSPQAVGLVGKRIPHRPTLCLRRKHRVRGQ